MSTELEDLIDHFLSEPKLQAPFITDSSNLTYQEELKFRLGLYLGKLDSLPQTNSLKGDVSAIRTDVETIINKINDAINLYLKGNSGIAYKEIEKLFNKPFMKKALAANRYSLDQYQIKTGCPDLTKALFRVRSSTEVINKRNEMFHIPFEKRHLVATQRYSIAGVPCLYFGNSLLLCWHEMGRPDLNSLSISYSHITPHYVSHVIDFAYSLNTLNNTTLTGKKEEPSGVKNKVIQQLLLFPLVMASSFVAKHKGSAFIEEYIIPNLITQWVSTEKSSVIGIRYLSTHLPHIYENELGINYVFPPDSQQIRNSGFCPELKNIFAISEPVSWQVADAINDEITVDSDKITLGDGDSLTEKMMKSYNLTKFHRIEQKIIKNTKPEEIEAEIQ